MFLALKQVGHITKTREKKIGTFACTSITEDFISDIKQTPACIRCDWLISNSALKDNVKINVKGCEREPLCMKHWSWCETQNSVHNSINNTWATAILYCIKHWSINHIQTWSCKLLTINIHINCAVRCSSNPIVCSTTICSSIVSVVFKTKYKLVSIWWRFNAVTAVIKYSGPGNGWYWFSSYITV